MLFVLCDVVLLVRQACTGYVYGESTQGQRALYAVGLTGIPVYNVNNNCTLCISSLMQVVMS